MCVHDVRVGVYIEWDICCMQMLYILPTFIQSNERKKIDSAQLSTTRTQNIYVERTSMLV